MTFTGFIGTVCMFPLRAIIAASIALRIHPNTLTLIGVLINVAAAWGLGRDLFVLAGVIMIVANIFDFIDGKVAHLTNTVSRFGAFWDSTLDRFSDIALFLGLIYLYADVRRTDYVMVTALAMMFSIMTVHNRIHYTFLALNGRPIPSGPNAFTAAISRAYFWRDERGTFPYDLW